MDFDGYYQLGYVVKSYGLKGEVIIHLDVDDPGHYSGLDLLFLATSGELIPYVVEKIQIQSNKARVKLEEFEMVEKAEEIISLSVYLPDTYLPELAPGEYYLHQLIGFDIYENNKKLGTVEQFYDLGKQTLLSASIEGKE